jgi:uncharacterized protein (DUF924 family)
MEQIEPKDVLGFWMEAGPEKWFAKSDAFDAELTTRFAAHLEAAKAGAYDGWMETTEGSLALIILLDQFSRNIHRGTPAAFAADAKALVLAKSLVERAVDMELPQQLRKWIYLPYEHSEDLQDQKICLEMFERSGLEENVKWAQLHLDAIEAFGRFPHRNEILGRVSSPAEIQFLKDGGFSG